MKLRGHRIPAWMREMRRLRQKHRERLLTLLAILLVLTMFVFAPLQAVGIFIFQGFAIAALLAIIGGMLIISDNRTAFVVMSLCLVANIVVFVMRLLYPPWPYNLYVLAAAWLAIAITLGVVVAQGVFRRGRITYHRIVGAILLYLLIAVVFGTLFIFVGLAIPDAFKGIAFEDNPALANSVFYLSFVTLTSTGYGDVVPVHPIARSLCNLESVIGQLFPPTLLARLVTLELTQRTSHRDIWPQRLSDARGHAVPCPGLVLAKEPGGRIPGAVVATEQPPPVGEISEQDPHRLRLGCAGLRPRYDDR